MHHPVQSTSSPGVSLPLRFTGGFGINSRRIGAIFTLYSIACMLFQFLLFPPITRRFGVLRCLRISFLIYPAVYVVTPFLSLLPTPRARELGIVGVLIFRGLAGTFAFPTSTIMITNSAGSLRDLATINGLATSVSAVGRAAGPYIGGNMFTYGVKNGYIILPFWALGAFAVCAWVPTLWLVEGNGFGDDPSDDEDNNDVAVVESDGDENDGDSVKSLPSDLPAANAAERRRSSTHSTSVFSSTAASDALLSDDENNDDVDNDDDPSQHHHRRTKSRLRTRSSVPIGMGLGFRRLSSNLGSTGVGGGRSLGPLGGGE